MLEDLLNNLENTVHWRRTVAERHPQDRRNEIAAETLERLKAEILSASDQTVLGEIEEIEEELLRLSDGNRQYDLSDLSVELNDLNRRIGFSFFPSGAEYLKSLLGIYREHRARAISTGQPQVVLAADLPHLPVQGPGPHFEFNKDVIIDFAPPAALDPEGNNVGRLRKLHPTLRELARQLSAVLASGNAPHVVLARRVDEYSKRIDQPIEMIDFSLLYIEGVRLANAEEAAREEIAKLELPPLAETDRETIQTLLDLHGAFILSTAAGAELIAAEERYQRRPKAEREYRAAAVDFAQSLQNHPAIITPDAAAFVLGAAQQIGEGTNPERSGVVGTSVIQNVAIVLAAGAVIAALPVVGNAIAGADGLVIAGVPTLLASQSLIKSKPFATVIAPLIGKLNQAATIDFSKARNFLISIEKKVRLLAKRSKNFHWLLKAIDWINPRELSFNRNLFRKITELPLSPEAITVLRNDNIVFIGDLVQRTVIDLFRFPGIDRSIVNEIIENLASIGFHLGMEILNWPPEDIEDAIKNAVDPDGAI